jgi:hypothetical protein
MNSENLPKPFPFSGSYSKHYIFSTQRSRVPESLILSYIPLHICASSLRSLVLKPSLQRERQGWGYLKQPTFNYIFSIKLSIILKNENFLDIVAYSGYSCLLISN